MNYYLITLRLLHIVPGIFWAGGVLYMAFFVMPAIQKLGPEGGKFMQQLARTNNMPTFMITLGTISVVSGLLLLWEVSGHLSIEWITSAHGLVLLTGATTATVALFIGFFVNRPSAKRIATLGAEIARAGAPPTPAQAQELGRLRNKVSLGTKMIASLMGVAILTMAMIRYL